MISEQDLDRQAKGPIVVQGKITDQVDQDTHANHAMLSNATGAKSTFQAKLRRPSDKRSVMSPRYDTRPDPSVSSWGEVARADELFGQDRAIPRYSGSHGNALRFTLLCYLTSVSN